MPHATPTQRALAAVRDEFVPLARVIDLAQRIAERDEDDPDVAAYWADRDFELQLAHERDEEAREYAAPDDAA